MNRDFLSQGQISTLLLELQVAQQKTEFLLLGVCILAQLLAVLQAALDALDVQAALLVQDVRHVQTVQAVQDALGALGAEAVM
jgi:hypothetical protein